MFKWRWELTLGKYLQISTRGSCIWIRRTSVSTYIICFPGGTSYPSYTVLKYSGVRLLAIALIAILLY